MRVLLPTIDALPARGGVARYIDAIVRTLLEVRVEVLANAQYAPLFRSLRKQWKAYDVLWIHHILPVGTVAWKLRLLGGAPYVIFLHGMDFDLARRNPWKRWLTRRILRGANRVVTNSQALANEVAMFAKIADPLVVYPCVDDDIVAAAETAFTISGQERVRLLTVGRLVERKGHMKVLEAIKDDTRFDYTIVGDGPMRATILGKIQEYGISSRVRVRSDVADADLPNVYRHADVFVMPSAKSPTDREGFGIVYLEAALFGVPSVAVRQPGVDEAVIDGETGVLIDDTTDALHRALTRMADDGQFRVLLGARARERVVAEFTREAQCARLRALL